MATYSKEKLSASTDGKQIEVTATATAGTTIHQAGAGGGVNIVDEVWIYLTNINTSSVEVTIEWGASGNDADNIVMTIPSKSGLTLAIPGLIITNHLYIKAFSSRGSAILASGYVNRITP